MALPGGHQLQIIVIVLANAYDDHEEFIPMPFTTSLQYDEILIHRLNPDDSMTGDTPFRIVINYEENDKIESNSEKSVDGIESRGRSM